MLNASPFLSSCRRGWTPCVQGWTWILSFWLSQFSKELEAAKPGAGQHDARSCLPARARQCRGAGRSQPRQSHCSGCSVWSWQLAQTARSV